MKSKIKKLSTFEKVIILEAVLSAIFIPLGYLIGNIYFRGVGVGLIISWVTGALANWRTHNKKD